ncbi:CUB domain-containing protein, partial [Neolewinella persica]|uniref:hypothetical protein n=1 Tax=Neolewinella persica TaxID=70998 RepID=UPI0004754C75
MITILPRTAIGRTLLSGALLCLFAFLPPTVNAQDIIHPTSGSDSYTVLDGSSRNYYDSGGAGGNYSAGESGSVTFCPSTPGEQITILFNTVDLETSSSGSGNFVGGCCWDALTISDGNGTLFEGCGEDSGDGGDACSSSQGENGPNDLEPGDSFTSTSADGCLTISFSSDPSVTEPGWAAVVSASGGNGCADMAGPTIDDATARPTCDETFVMETNFDYVYTVTPPSNGTSNSRDCRSAVIWRTPRFSDDCGVDSVSISFFAESSPAPTIIPDALTYGPGSTEIMDGETNGFVQFITPSTYFYGSGASASTTTGVLYEVFDAEGNVETCTFYIEVVDNEDPIIDTCPEDFETAGDDSVIGNGNGSNLAYSEATVTITEAQFTAEGGVIDENCGIETITYVDTQMGMEPTIVTRTFTVTDYVGLSDECEQTITINECIVDLTCQDVTVYVDDAGNASITPEEVQADGSCDNSGLSLSQSTFICDDVANGPVTVTLMQDNQTQGKAPCTAQITVLDTIRPVIVCEAITVAIGADGTAMIENDDAVVSIDDNCDMDPSGPFTVGGPINGRTFDCSFVGTTVQRTVVATDMSGNRGECTYDVTIVDEIPPTLECPAELT